MNMKFKNLRVRDGPSDGGRRRYSVSPLEFITLMTTRGVLQGRRTEGKNCAGMNAHVLENLSAGIGAIESSLIEISSEFYRSALWPLIQNFVPALNP